MAKIKKNISLEEDILRKGLARAEQLGYNFSSYITYLINQDSEGITVKKPEIKEPKSNEDTENNKEELENFQLNDDILGEINNITNNFY